MINTASQTIGGNEFLISGLETTRESYGGKGGEKNISNFHTKWISDLNVKKRKHKITRPKHQQISEWTMSKKNFPNQDSKLRSSKGKCWYIWLHFTNLIIIISQDKKVHKQGENTNDKLGRLFEICVSDNRLTPFIEKDYSHQIRLDFAVVMNNLKHFNGIKHYFLLTLCMCPLLVSRELYSHIASETLTNRGFISNMLL